MADSISHANYGTVTSQASGRLKDQHPIRNLALRALSQLKKPFRYAAKNLLAGPLARIQGKDDEQALLAQQWDQFYYRFEERFRGSSSLILDRLSVRYSSLLHAAKDAAENSTYRLLDLGCGHGEMLDVAKKAGVEPFGVDLSQRALDASAGKGYTVILEDIVSFLKKQKEGSFAFITLLHVIEHCPPLYVFEIFREVYRILPPGGHFLVETPSLYSLWVSSRQFYLDPTHIRPVHPEYIRFLGEDTGFAQSTELPFDPVQHPLAPRLEMGPLQEELSNLKALGTWQDWFFGPMDIAFVFTK